MFAFCQSLSNVMPVWWNFKTSSKVSFLRLWSVPVMRLSTHDVLFTIYSFESGFRSKARNYISHSDWCPAGVLKPWSCLISVTDAQHAAPDSKALWKFKRGSVWFAVFFWIYHPGRWISACVNPWLDRRWGRKTEWKSLIRVSRVIWVIKCLFYPNQSLLRWDQTLLHYGMRLSSADSIYPSSSAANIWTRTPPPVTKSTSAVVYHSACSASN